MKGKKKYTANKEEVSSKIRTTHGKKKRRDYIEYKIIESEKTHKVIRQFKFPHTSYL